MSYMTKKPRLDKYGCIEQMHVEYDLGHMYVWLEGESADAPAQVILQFMSLSTVNNGKHYANISTEGAECSTDDMLKIIRMGKQYARKLDQLVK